MLYFYLKEHFCSHSSEKNEKIDIKPGKTKVQVKRTLIKLYFFKTTAEKFPFFNANGQSWFLSCCECFPFRRNHTYWHCQDTAETTPSSFCTCLAENFANFAHLKISVWQVSKLKLTQEQSPDAKAWVELAGWTGKPDVDSFPTLALLANKTVSSGIKQACVQCPDLRYYRL